MANTVHEGLSAGIKSLRTSGDYSDLVIACGSDMYNVHKAIVCPQSKFLQKAESFPWASGEENGKVDLSHDDPEAVKLLVQFLYESDYDPSLPIDRYDAIFRVWKVPTHDGPVLYHYGFPHSCQQSGYCHNPSVCSHHGCGGECRGGCVNFICPKCTSPLPPNGDGNQLILHTKMYEIGDKYDVLNLKNLAREKFLRACRQFWNDEKFPIAAAHALDTTLEKDMGLRSIICTTLANHKELLNKKAIQLLLMKRPAFLLYFTQVLAAC